MKLKEWVLLAEYQELQHELANANAANAMYSEALKQAQEENRRLTTAVRRLIEYRDASGALNFQLEKADDFINEIRAAIIRAEEGE